MALNIEDLLRQQAEAQAAAQAAARRDALIATGLGLLGTQRGREMEGFSRAGLLGLTALRSGQDRAPGMSTRDMLALYEYQQKDEERKQAQAAQEAMRGAAQSSIVGGAPEMGPPTPGGALQPAVPGQFDPAQYAQRLYAMGRVPEAMAVERQYAKPADMPYDKPKPENYTPASLAKFAQSRNPADLVPVSAEPALPVGKVNASDFTPTSVQAFIAGGGKDYSLLQPIDKTPRTTVNVDARGRGKAPEGFQWAADGESLMPIPGGPKDTSQKDTARAEGAINRADLIIGKVEKAIGQVGLKSAGLGGAVMAHIPGTVAVDLRKTVDTIKANIGFQELQAMREASPTGGALGQVAVQELNMLQSVISSLDAEQSPQQLRESLNQVKGHFDKWKYIVKKAAAGRPVGTSGGWSITEEK